MAELSNPLLERGTLAPNEVSIDYIKAPDFRSVWVDGAIGSPTPNGNIHVAFYSERPAIPRRQVHTVDLEKHELGPAIPEKTISRNSLIREMSIDILLSLRTAEMLASFFTDQVTLLKEARTKHE